MVICVHIVSYLINLHDGQGYAIYDRYACKALVSNKFFSIDDLEIV